jgi:predicted HTH domain antitoxin
VFRKPTHPGGTNFAEEGSFCQVGIPPVRVDILMSMDGVGWVGPGLGIGYIGDGATERDHGAEPLDHTAVEWERRLPMSQVTFSIPDEFLLALKATPEILAARIRIAAAVKLYEMGQLSSGATSQLAGVPRPYFLGHLADYGVNTFDLSEEELIHDLKSA